MMVVLRHAGMVPVYLFFAGVYSGICLMVGGLMVGGELLGKHAVSV